VKDTGEISLVNFGQRQSSSEGSTHVWNFLVNQIHRVKFFKIYIFKISVFHMRDKNNENRFEILIFMCYEIIQFD